MVWTLLIPAEMPDRDVPMSHSVNCLFCFSFAPCGPSFNLSPRLRSKADQAQPGGDPDCTGPGWHVPPVIDFDRRKPHKELQR
jgi:hypothetical protein